MYIVLLLPYDRKEIMDIRTAISHLRLDKEFFFTDLDGRDILQTPDWRRKPEISREKISVPCEDQTISG